MLDAAKILLRPLALYWFEFSEWFYGRTGQIARDYLATASQPIRLFVSIGNGYGDQVVTFNLIHFLLNNIDDATIEVIGSHASIGSGYEAKTPLTKIMELFAVNPGKFDEIITLNLTSRFQVQFIPYEVFKNKKEFSSVELAMFVGPYYFFEREYREELNNGVDLNGIARANRAIFFDPFYGEFLKNHFSGYAWQLRYQPMQHNPFTTVLPYTIKPPSRQLVANALQRYTKIAPRKAHLIQLIEKRDQQKINMIAIYGLNRILHTYPEHKLLNIVLSAMEVSRSQHKKLIAVILNDFDDKTWDRFIQLFSATHPPALKMALQRLAQHKIFVDAQNNSPVISLGEEHTIIRLGHLPAYFFNQLFLSSDLPPLYEGAGADILLANAAKWGLVCKKENQHRVNNLYTLPRQLVKAHDYICTSERLEQAWLAPVSPIEKIVPLMHKYASNNSIPRSLLSTIDRFSHAVATVSQQPDCALPYSLLPNANCAFFKPVQVQHAVAAVSSYTLEMTMYRILEELTFSVSQQAANFRCVSNQCADTVALRFGASALRHFAVDHTLGQAYPIKELPLLLLLRFAQCVFSSQSSQLGIGIAFRMLILMAPICSIAAYIDMESAALGVSLLTFALLGDIAGEKIANGIMRMHAADENNQTPQKDNQIAAKP